MAVIQRENQFTQSQLQGTVSKSQCRPGVDIGLEAQKRTPIYPIGRSAVAKLVGTIGFKSLRYFIDCKAMLQANFSGV